MKYNLNEVADRRRIVQNLSRNGRFQVLFVSYPQHPDIFEFVARSDDGECIRYINIDAKPGAKISRFI